MQESDPHFHLELARERTETRRLDLTESLAAIVEASESANLDDEHDPEGSTVGFERAQVQALLDAAHTRLAELAAARDRVERRTYGICERCSAQIAPARLEAQPAVRTCVACASRTRAGYRSERRPT